MPPLLNLTLFISLSSKPHISLLLRRSSASLSPPATFPLRLSQYLPISLNLSQPQSQSLSLHTYNCTQRRELGAGGDRGGSFVTRFSRRVGGDRGGGSGLFGEMGSETNNNNDNNYRDFLNNNLSVSSGLIKQNSLNHKDRDRYDRNNEITESPSKQPRHQSTKLLTLPTILTIGRVAAVPLLVCTFYMDTWWGTTATTSIFIAAAITDWLDGYLARKMKLGSAFGAFLDPVADKLMVAATLVLLCAKPPQVVLFEQFPWLLTIPSIAIIGREITMSAVREWAASQSGNLSEAVAVNNLGKWKTATQMIALTILLAIRDGSLAGPGVLVTSGVTLLYISAWLAVWSLVVYMKKIWKVLLK
ncbi:CDP-diacylglycerol--glycerol-3-phosphate 3-phosphatidyltransferase 2-like [Apium graveolens]|uniref:CDP-diacylglycerol--glycerol-3-phosphate 3-phosphatidyltransferase 2-like n=1 Tax=Apium graveolens TaxID=4045 RepID=UPI003D79C26B